MSPTTLFHAIGDFLTWTFGIFEFIGNSFNYAVILLGFVGLFYWLNLQRKFNAQAENDPNKLK
jgi:hypothetical protein